jgi:hypothetical protein
MLGVSLHAVNPIVVVMASIIAITLVIRFAVA